MSDAMRHAPVAYIRCPRCAWCGCLPDGGLSMLERVALLRADLQAHLIEQHPAPITVAIATTRPSESE